MPFKAEEGNPGKVLRGIETFNFDGNTLYDKIINLKLTRRDGSSITIRSDYEVVKIRDKEGKISYYFQTIKQKPSISVKYRQVGSSTMIKVEIRISNLYFTEGDADAFTNAEGSNPVTKILINMGYRSQFRAWPQQIQIAPEKALEAFYNLDDFVIRDSNDIINSGFSAEVKVLDSWPESNPPDRTVYFHCIVGNAESGLKFLLENPEGSKDNFVKYFSNPDNYPTECTNYMDRICFLYITRRFFRSNVLWREKLDDDGNPVEKVYQVHEYKRDDSGTLVPYTEEDKENSKPEERWTDVELTNENCMSVKDAEVLGIKVTCSEMVRKRAAESAVLSTPDGVKSLTAETAPSILWQDKLAAQIQAIEQSVLAGIKPFTRPDSSIMLCHENEDAKAVLENYDDPVMYGYACDPEKLIPILLPAIYDRTVNGTRTLRLPFIGFLSTGMFLGFSNRYLLGSLVSFYSPRIEDRWYKVVYSDVEFDTDGDKNMCTAVCVDAEYAPGEKELTKKEEDTEVERSVEWIDVQCIKGTATEFGTIPLLQWSTLAAMTLGSGGTTAWAKANSDGKEFMDDVASAFPDGKYDPVEAVKLLLDKNSSLKGSSWQEGTGIYAGLELPWLHWGDTVKLPRVKEG